MKQTLLFTILFLSAAIAQQQTKENKYIKATLTVTQADIINASVLVDPLAEKLKDISRSNFSLFIENLEKKDIKANLEIESYVTLEEDRKREESVRASTRKLFSIPIGGKWFDSKAAEDPGSDISLTKVVNESLKKRLKDKILDPASGGRVPSGLYELSFTITVEEVDGQKATGNTRLSFSESINVTNPTTAVLDVPFTNGYIYPTPFPQFQWTYDTRGVMLSVYELRPEHQSLEDAIGASDPYLQVKIDRKQTGNMSSFTYPQNASPRPGIEYLRGPRQLERGKLYVVVLDGITTAFGFEVDPLRTIRSFGIADPQGQVVINILQTTFGGSEFQNIFNLIQDLNLQLNVSGITLNGVALSPQDLQKLLIENKDRIISVRFED